MTLGFIGCGKMASALVRGVLRAGVVSAERVVVSDCYAIAAQQLASDTGVKALATNAEVVSASETVLLCVKPQEALEVLKEAASALSGKLVVSIAAGVSLRALEAATGVGVRVVRVMPNTPALVQRAASAYALGTFAVIEKILN
jgi:pyrroline-5-carboxylate reductase